jgi:hypothetical protein
MRQESFDDILQAIDRPDCDPIDVDGPDESLPREMDEDQEEGIFVRGREGWVDIDQYAPCKIVFRFKWKRQTSNKSKRIPPMSLRVAKFAWNSMYSTH